MARHTLKTGDKIWTRKAGVRHYGIYVGEIPGYEGRWVIHNSKDHGRVVCEQLEWFSTGNPIYIEQRARRGSEHEVVQRAWSYADQRYDLLAFNCEHLATYATTGVPSSAQVAAGLGLVAVLVIGGVALASAR